MNMKLVAAIGVPVALAAVIAVGQWFTFATMGNTLEQGIAAQYEDNKNVLARYTNTIATQAQIPEMAKNDLREVITASLQARYGEGGSDATIQWIRENYPGKVDPQLYQNLMVTIESGRLDFSESQTKLIDMKRVYQTKLGNPWSGFWLKLAGYPKINLDEYKIVLNERTEQAFESGRDEPMQLNVN